MATPRRDAEQQLNDLLDSLKLPGERVWASVPCGPAGIVVTDQRVLLFDYEVESAAWGQEFGNPALRAVYAPEQVRVAEYSQDPLVSQFSAVARARLVLEVDGHREDFYERGDWMAAPPFLLDAVVAALGGNTPAHWWDRIFKSHRRVEPRPRAHHHPPEP